MSEEFHQFRPYFFTREGAALSLVGLHRGASAFLIGGGPSFAAIDKSKLGTVWAMTLNNAAASYRGQANCTAWEPSRLNYSMWLDPTVQKFVPYSAFESPLWDNRRLKVDGDTREQWQPGDLLVGDCPNVIGYRRNEQFQVGQFLGEDTINCGNPIEARGVGRSVLLPALRILFLLGFRKVYLLGVDFKMPVEQPYHFPETCSPETIEVKTKTYVLMQQWLAELQPHFLSANFVVRNCNPESELKAFPFLSLKEALEEATAPLGDHLEQRTRGMNAPWEEKEAEITPERTQAAMAEGGLTVKPSTKARNLGNLQSRHRHHAAAAPGSNGARKLILQNFQSPGDVVMLTAAVRDLHRCYPGQFETDVKTSCPHLWENNPYLSLLEKKDLGTEVIDCQYPLIHRSNLGSWHFIHGFMDFLNSKLDLQIEPTEFKGDIHLSQLEKTWASQVQEITREAVPFWIITAGGKMDYTIKWWSHERFQSVVDYFRGKILFVQVGEKGHRHPPLDGVLDLRGKTDLRELVRLVHHSQGVLCPVTLLMHLAAAVEPAAGMPGNRACVVVAGGREPSQWEAYPHHQFIHTNGSLPCCDKGGCWKSRTTPLGDGDSKDKPENLCVDVVLPGRADARREKRGNAYSFAQTDWPGLLPRCMDMIKVEEVIRRVELYFDGGAIKYLSEKESRVSG